MIIDIATVNRHRREAALTSTMREILRLVDAAENDTESVIDMDGDMGRVWQAALARARHLVAR